MTAARVEGPHVPGIGRTGSVLIEEPAGGAPAGADRAVAARTFVDLAVEVAPVSGDRRLKDLAPVATGAVPVGGGTKPGIARIGPTGRERVRAVADSRAASGNGRVERMVRVERLVRADRPVPGRRDRRRRSCPNGARRRVAPGNRGRRWAGSANPMRWSSRFHVPPGSRDEPCPRR